MTLLRCCTPALLVLACGHSHPMGSEPESATPKLVTSASVRAQAAVTPAPAWAGLTLPYAPASLDRRLAEQRCALAARTLLDAEMALLQAIDQDGDFSWSTDGPSLWLLWELWAVRDPVATWSALWLEARTWKLWTSRGWNAPRMDSTEARCMLLFLARRWVAVRAAHSS